MRAQLATAAVPSGLVSSAHLRLTRPGTPLARDWEALAGSAGSASAPSTSRPPSRPRRRRRSPGARVRRLRAPRRRPGERPHARGHAARASHSACWTRAPQARRSRARPRPTIPRTDALRSAHRPARGEDVSDIARDVVAGARSARRRAREPAGALPALAGLLPADSAPDHARARAVLQRRPLRRPHPPRRRVPAAGRRAARATTACAWWRATPRSPPCS